MPVKPQAMIEGSGNIGKKRKRNLSSLLINKCCHTAGIPEMAIKIKLGLL